MRDPEAFDDAVEIVGGWARDERREGVKVLLQSLAERQIGRRDQAARWLWHLAEYSREVHEEYAVQRWPETKRLLGLLVNSAGAAHARNARRLVQAARKQDRRLSAALLAAALAHTPEAQQVLDGARMRMARKPSALARELLRNFPKGKRRRGGRRRRKKGGGEAAAPEVDGAEHGGRSGRRRGAATTRRTGARRRRWRGRRRRRRARRGLAELVSAAGEPRRPARATRPESVSTSSAPSPSIPAAVPAPPFQRTSEPSSASRRRHSSSTSSSGLASRVSSRASSAASTSSVPARPAGDAASEVAMSRSSAGKSSAGVLTLRPMPSTAQPSCGRPSTRIPASLRPSSSTSFGHLIWHSAGTRLGHRHRGGQRQRLGAGRGAPPTSAAPSPGGASQVRPWRPRPAVCSLAVTSVPCGAPGARPAPWRARSWSRPPGDGRAALPIIRAAAGPRRRRPRSSIAAASPRLTASASVR